MTDTLAQAPLSLVPFADRMIVRIIGESDRTKSGLFVPQLAQDNKVFLRAEVLFVGPGRHVAMTGAQCPVQFQPGAVVVFIRTAETRGSQIMLPDEEDLMLISESHVAYEIKGLERVSGLVDDTGRNMVLQ